MIILGITTENRTPVGRGKAEATRWLNGLLKLTLNHAATYWHRVILLKHFTPNARFAYRYESRRKWYIEGVKKEEGVGEGKTALLQFEGKSKRYMLAFVEISGTSKRATVTMRPPYYFKNPFLGTRTDPETGKSHTISHQPDKEAEVTAQTDKDKQDVRNEAAGFMARMMRETMPVKRTKT